MTRLEPILELLELIPSAGRLRVLNAVHEAGELTPLGALQADAAPSLGMAAYHVRRLVTDGLLELVREEPRRGATAHFYRVTPAGARVLEVVDGFAAAAGLALEEAAAA